MEHPDERTLELCRGLGVGLSFGFPFIVYGFVGNDASFRSYAEGLRRELGEWFEVTTSYDFAGQPYWISVKKLSASGPRINRVRPKPKKKS